MFSRIENLGYVLLFCSPDEFYVKLINGSEPIKISKNALLVKIPSKNEVYSTAKFVIEYNCDYVLCEILEDLKYDEVFCQVLLCNSKIKLKVDFRRLSFLNHDDLINDENCISLKFHDFSPIFPNNWSPDLILKLNKLLTFNKFIFQLKSLKPDPSDGRYSVDILRNLDHRSVIEEFIDGKQAMRGSEYYKLVLENEISQIFNIKKSQGFRYKISVPLAKNKPISQKLSKGKKLNVEAEPFTPIQCYYTSTIESNSTEKCSDKDKSQVLPQINDVNLSQTSNAQNVISKPEYLTSNIVNMLAEMYKNHPYKESSSGISSASYQAFFPDSTGKYFSKPTLTLNPENTTIFSKTLSHEIIEKPMMSNLKTYSDDNNSKTIESIPVINSANPVTNNSDSFVISQDNSSYVSNQSDPESFVYSFNSNFVLDNETNTLTDISSIPLPPDRIVSTSNFILNGSPSINNENLIACSPVANESLVSDSYSKYFNGSSSEPNEKNHGQIFNNDVIIGNNQEISNASCNQNLELFSSSPFISNTNTGNMPILSNFSYFNNLTLDPSSVNSQSGNNHNLSPLCRPNMIYNSNMFNKKPLPIYGNYHFQFLQSSQQPAHIIPHSNINPLDNIHINNLLPFYPSLQIVPMVLLKNNYTKPTIPIKDMPAVCVANWNTNPLLLTNATRSNSNENISEDKH